MCWPRNKCEPVNVSIRKLASACRLYFSWGCTRITETGWLLSKVHEKVRNKGMISKQSTAQQNRTDTSCQNFMSVWFICWKSTVCSLICIHSTRTYNFSLTYTCIFSIYILLFIYICSIFTFLYKHRVNRQDIVMLSSKSAHLCETTLIFLTTIHYGANQPKETTNYCK